MDTGLRNKTALITGSTSGIGLATAKALLREGASVWINGRSTKSINEAIDEIKHDLPDAVVNGLAADFAKPDDITRLLNELPNVDILINNVALFETKAFADITDDEWHLFYEVNVLSGVRLSRHYLPKMLAKNWGRILFTSSESAINILADNIHYGMTKAAVLAISRGLAEITKGTAVTVNAIVPGPTKTEKFGGFLRQMAQQQHLTDAQMDSAFFEQQRPTSLLQRFATPDEIANLMVYMASECSSATNGTAMRADGGIVKTIF